MRLNISAYADFELLHVVDDNEFTTVQLAEFLEAELRSVGTRMAWMRRQTLVRQRSDGVWILSRRGQAILNGRSNSLEQIRQLSIQTAHDPTMNWIARREWARNVAR